MPLFPAFISLESKDVLVVGGGEVALRKILKLLKFTDNITVVAPTIKKEIVHIARQKGLKILRRRFLLKDLEEKDLVIVAVDNIKLQARIFRECEKRKILCNCVDSPELCSFIFPSLIVEGELVVGITTGGKAPALSKRVKEIIQKSLPENLIDIFEKVATERQRQPKGKKRQKQILELVDRLLPDT